MVESCQVNKLTSKGAAFSELIIEIFRANRLLLDAGDGLSAPVGLSSARWQVLGIVGHHPASVADVARLMGLTRQSVRQTADTLAAEGLIEYVENPHHLRAKLMKMTPKAQKALDYVEQQKAGWANALAAKQALHDLQTALAVLQTMRETLEQNTLRARKAKALRRAK